MAAPNAWFGHRILHHGQNSNRSNINSLISSNSVAPGFLKCGNEKCKFLYPSIIGCQSANQLMW